MADVFISYARADREVAERFAAELEALGTSIWMDSQITGGSTFTKVTEEELNRSKKVIVLWSKASIDSGWVCDEAQLGREQGKLVPLSIDGSQPPMGFRQIQTIDVAGWAGGKQTALSQALLDALSLEGKPVEASQDVGRRLPAGRRNLLLTALAALVVLLGGGLVLWHFGPGARSGAGGKGAEVMVMPFTAVGTDPDEMALARGITQELIVRLRRVPKLKVLIGTASAANSKSGYTGDRIDGAVQLDGERLRVSPTLSNADGNVLWSDNFDSKLNNMLEVQEDIARSVANSLSVSLDVGIDSREYGGTDNPEAYADWVQGLSYTSNADPARGLDYLKHAVALDPGYVKGWAAIGSVYGFLLYAAKTREEADSLLAKLDEASSNALNLNPNLWIGQSQRGWYAIAKGDYVSASARIQRMMELDTGNDSLLTAELGRWATEFGRVRKAIEFEQPSALDDPYWRTGPSLASDLLRIGRYDDAKNLFDELIAEDPTVKGFSGPDIYWAYLLTGEADKAKNFAATENLESFYQDVPNFRFDPEFIPSLPPDQLKRWADRKFGYGGKQQLQQRALFASHFGHQKLALEYLQLAFQRPGAGIPSELWHPALAKLRKTPEFVQFITNLGLVEAWRKSSDWGDFCAPGLNDVVTCH